MARSASLKIENSDVDRSVRVAEFMFPLEKAFREAEREAEEAMDTTNTAFWQKHFRAEIGRHEQEKSTVLRELADATSSIAAVGLTEDTEKSLKDIAKKSADERARHHAWRVRCVQPYERVANAAAKAKEEVLIKARSAAVSNPLYDSDLPKEVTAITKNWANIKWNEKDGIITFE